MATGVADEITLGHGDRALAYLQSQDGDLTDIYGPISAADVTAILAQYGYSVSGH